MLSKPYAAEFSVKLVPSKERKQSTQLFAKKVMHHLASTFPGPEFKTYELNILGNSTDPIEIYVRGSDYEKTKAYSKVVMEKLKSIEGTSKKNTGTIKEELVALLAKIDRPAGVDVYYSGDMERQSESFSSLLVALIASILLIYLIMVALYDSYVHPFVVMLSLPLSIIGALLALALAHKTLSIFSIMGIIMLMGLVAKNAILVVDFANDLRNKGIKAAEAAVEVTRLRFRPILMTNLALIVGMLPIALASGPGSEWKSSMGWVLIGGLTSSLLLSLIVGPVLFVIFDRFVKRRNLEELESAENTVVE